MLKSLAYYDQKWAEINPSFNEFVTEFCHGDHIHITPSLRKFLERAYQINTIEQRVWCYGDFKHITNASFRKNIQRLAPLIEKIINSRPCFYKLKAINLPHVVTKKSRWVYPKTVEPEFEEILVGLKNQPPMMHDIRIEARIAGLFENFMSNTDLEPNPHNWAFTMKISAGKRFDITINIYRNNKMQVIIGCTHNPIPYTPSGFHELTALLGQICWRLRSMSGDEFFHSPIPEWKMQYLHLNRDGVEINGNRYSYSITDLASHSVFYLKKCQDGHIRPRFEEHQRPNQTIEKMMNSVIDL